MRKTFAEMVVLSFAVAMTLSCASSDGTPTVGSVRLEAAYPGAVLLVDMVRTKEDSGFVLVVEGALSPADSGLPFDVLWTLDVQDLPDGEFRVDVPREVLGAEAGHFEGQVWSAPLGWESGSRPAPPDSVIAVGFDYGPPRIDAFEPSTFQRGQWVAVHGAGFTRADADDRWASYVLLDGVFEPLNGTTESWRGDYAVPIFPDEVSSPGTFRFVARHYLPLSDDPLVAKEGEADGLGARPGVFRGEAVPVLVEGTKQHEGEPFPVALEVGCSEQFVWLRLTPSFDEALEKFGLALARDAIVARVLAACRRDYEGIAVRFVTEEPMDFHEFTRVDIMGGDPNRAGLLGLDNTKDKDVGNLRWDDVLGGYNGESAAAGYHPYGGVFVESLLQFSPTLGDPGSGMVSRRFDDVFGAFVPSLGGVPFASGERRDVAEAVRVLGNLIGTTASHELGHALGLAAVDGEVHNVGDEPDRIMDAGMYRPFEERAELDGQGPAVFAPHNWTYLYEILPNCE